MSKQFSYRVRSTIKVEGSVHKTGDVVVLAEATGTSLVESGHVVLDSAEPAEPSKPTPKPAVTKPAPKGAKKKAR